MEFQGYHHFAIQCKDIKESLHFYHDLLGLPISRIVKGEDMDVYYVMSPDGVELEFMDLKGKQEAFEPRPYEHVGGHHFGFIVDDPTPYWDLLSKEGYKANIPLCRYDKYMHYTCGFFDPDGIMCEFITPYYAVVEKAVGGEALYK